MCESFAGFPIDTWTRREIIATQHQADAREWAVSVFQEVNVIFLDTETTGLGEDAEIIDIAIVDRNGRVLLDTLVRPSGLIPGDSTAIHGLDDPAVADAPTWDQVYPLVGRILDRYGPVVIYNSDFDTRVLQQSNRIYGLPAFAAEWHCAMRQFAAYAGIWHDRHGTWRWHKLMDALQMMGRPLPRVQHRALADADACRQIVELMASGIEPIPLSADVLASRSVALPSEHPQGDSGSAPLRPEIVGPGEQPFGSEDDPDFQTRSGTFSGGQFTVISSRSAGCSPGLLVAILIGGTIVIGVGCCLFFYVGARLFL